MVLTDKELEEKFKHWVSRELWSIISEMEREGTKNDPFYKNAVNEMNRRSGLEERLE